jgi:TRAP-type C4-dicarboxylate transport system permease small subunit
VSAAIDNALAFLRRLEDGILVSLLILMIGMAAGQVVLRNFFDSWPVLERQPCSGCRALGGLGRRHGGVP